MAIDSLSAWKSDFNTLPLVSDTSWAANFANWVDGHVTNKCQLQEITNPSPEFTFNKSIFEAQLVILPKTASDITGITNFANAWETAIFASTMLIIAGAFKGSASPSTTWSAVFTSIIDPPSVAVGKSKIMELVSAPKVVDPNDSIFPEKIRDAFLLLTGSVSGLDSDPLGPKPFSSLFTPFV